MDSCCTTDRAARGQDTKGQDRSRTEVGIELNNGTMNRRRRMRAMKSSFLSVDTTLTLIDLAENNHARKLCLWIIGDGRMEEENP